MKKIPRCAKGRHGYRFVFRDVGQRIKISDYNPAALQSICRGYGTSHGIRFDEGINIRKKKQLKEALADFHKGKYITAPIFKILCKQHDVKMSYYVRCMCIYMNELDVSIRTIRHKNSRGDFEREVFDGLFEAIQKLIVNTL